jgi:hypothetical protein
MGNRAALNLRLAAWPCASRSRARVRVFARKSAAMDPAATRGLRTRRDAALQPVCPGRSSALACLITVATLCGLPRSFPGRREEGGEALPQMNDGQLTHPETRRRSKSI